MATRTFICTVLIALLFVGCKSKTVPNEGVKVELPKFVLIESGVYLRIDKAISKRMVIHQKMNRALFDLNVEPGDQADPVKRQIAAVEKLIKEKVAVILIIPADATEITPTLAKAVKAGIVVVNLAVQLDKKSLDEQKVKIPFVGLRKAEGANELIELVGKANPKTKRAIVLAELDLNESELVHDSVIACLKQADWEVVADQQIAVDDFKTRSAAGSITIQNLLKEHADVSLIVCCSDLFSTGVASGAKKSESPAMTVTFANRDRAERLTSKFDLAAVCVTPYDELAIYGVGTAISLLDPANDAEEIGDNLLPATISTNSVLSAIVADSQTPPEED